MVNIIIRITRNLRRVILFQFGLETSRFAYGRNRKTLISMISGFLDESPSGKTRMFPVFPRFAMDFMGCIMSAPGASRVLMIDHECSWCSWVLMMHHQYWWGIMNTHVALWDLMIETSGLGVWGGLKKPGPTKSNLGSGRFWGAISIVNTIQRLAQKLHSPQSFSPHQRVHASVFMGSADWTIGASTTATLRKVMRFSMETFPWHKAGEGEGGGQGSSMVHYICTWLFKFSRTPINGPIITKWRFQYVLCFVCSWINTIMFSSSVKQSINRYFI